MDILKYNILMSLIILIIIIILYYFYFFFKNQESFIEMYITPLNKNNTLSIKNKEFLQILKSTKRALNSLNIPFFLSSGTLLGAIREGQFIEHDYDIDVGIFKKDFSPELINKMSEQGLELYRSLGSIENGYELSFKKKDSPLGMMGKIDIFLHYNETIEGQKYIYWKSYNGVLRNKEIKYRVPHFGIKQINFMGIEVGVPNPPEDYLKSHYGDWWIPKKRSEYSFDSSPLSIVKDEKNIFMTFYDER
jgi:phosphorylcholine metabolism protein LicD